MYGNWKAFTAVTFCYSVKILTQTLPSHEIPKMKERVEGERANEMFQISLFFFSEISE